MSKKRTNSRLEKLFDGVTPEKTKPVGVDRKEKSAPPIRQIIAGQQPAQAVKTTGALPSLESQVVAAVSKTDLGARLELAFPMDAQNWATLQVLDENKSRSWDDDEKLLVKQVTDQLSLALENARLFQQTQQQASELAILNEMGRELATRLDVTAICEAVYRYTTNLMDTTNFFISLYDEESQTIQYAIIYNDGERIPTYARPLGQGLSDYVLRNRQALFLEEKAPERMRELGIDLIPIGDSRPPLCWLGVPLTVGTEILGIIAVQSVTTHGLYTRHHFDLLGAIANQSAIAVANAQLFQQTEQQASELAILNEMGRELSAVLDISASCETVHKYTSQLMDTASFYVALLDEPEERVDFPFLISKGQRIESDSHKLGNGLTEYVLKTQQPLFIPENVDARMQQLGIDLFLIGNNKTAECWMGVPLKVGDQTTGMIALQNTEKPHHFTGHQFELLKTIANQAAISLENARLFEAEQRRAKELNTLVELSRLISQNLNLEEVYATAHRIISQVMNTDAFFINTYEPGADGYTNAYDIDNGVRMTPQFHPSDAGFTGHVLKLGESYIAYDTHHDPAPSKHIAEIDQYITPRSVIATPLRFSGQIIGVISAQSYKPNTYTTDDLHLLESFADTIATGIQNARLFQQTELRAEEMGVLNDLGRALSTQMDLNQVLQETYHGVARLMDASNFFIGIYDEETHRVTFPINVTESEIDKEIESLDADSGMTGYIYRNRAPLLIKSDVDKWLAKEKIEAVGQIPTSWLGVPLVVGNQFLGLISVQSLTRKNVYTEHDRDMLLAFANQAAIAIQNANLFQVTKERNKQLAALNDIIGSASQFLDEKALLTSVLEKVLETTGFDGGVITLFNESRKKLERIARIGMPGDSPADPAEGLDNSLCKYVYDTGSTIVTDDFRKGAEVDVTAEIEAGLLGYVGVPLEAKGKVLGTICIFRKIAAPIPADTSTLIQSVGRQIGFAIENAQLFQQAQHKAEIERLTGEISNIFASVDPLEVSDAINQALQKLGEFAHVDRAYMFLNDPETKSTNCTNEWCAEEVASQIENLQNIPEDAFPYLQARLRDFKIFYAQKVAQLPQEASAEKQEFEREGIKSIICVPLVERGSLIGFLGLDTVKAERVWGLEEQNLLRVTGETIVTAIGRRKAAEALSKSEAELRALFSSMTDVIIVYDRNGRYVRIAPTNPNRLYRPVDEMIGKTIQEILPPETHEPFLKAIQQALETEETVRIEYPLEVNERVFWFDASVSKLAEEQVFWVSRDITERKHAEEAIRRQNEYLATAAEIGRLITSTLDINLLFSRAVNLIRERFGFYHAAIFTIEETGFNAILREGTGDAGSEMKQRQHSLAVGSKSVIGKVTENGEAVVINNTALDPTHRHNPLLPETRAEAGIPLRVSNRVIGALDIQSSQVDSFTQDNIAVLQILADQIAVAIDNARSYDLAQQAVKEMREIDRLKSQFLANMSHELRTPLNSIIGFSRVILKGIDGPISELQQQDLSAIYNSGQHLLGLINDILDLSRIEAGKMELTFDEINISDTINSVMSTIAGMIKEKSITLKKIIPDDLPPVRADSMRIRQVLLNLMSNAAKFTDEGSITVEASVKAGPSGHPEVMIGVTDSGPGISPEDQTKLFQAFSQVDSSPTRKTGGSGLGLSISQHLVQMHGGRIGLHSVVGKGSTFYFTLPVYRGKEEAGKSNKVVLAIDDDPQVVSLYERYLQPQGYQVVSLSDPSKAVERVRQLKPFAITLDIMMPGYDGWQVIQDLKAQPDTRSVPVIICSIVEDEEKGFSLGAAEYLVKPVMEDDLLNALNRLNTDGSIREVLVIDDDADDLRLMGKILSDDGRYRPVLAEGGKNGWASISTNPPHAIILDLFMADLDGFTILERLRETEKYRQIPVLVVTGGDLSTEQQEQLTTFGQRLIQKGSFNENEFLSTLENVLKRVAPQ